MKKRRKPAMDAFFAPGPTTSADFRTADYNPIDRKEFRSQYPLPYWTLQKRKARKPTEI